MTVQIPTQPSITRLTGLLSVAVGAGLLLASISLTVPPLDPVRFVGWWEAHGTAVATVSLCRLAGLLVAIGLTTAAVLGLVATLARTAAPLVVWHRTTPTALRRMMAGTVVVVAASNPAAALAADQTDHVPLLHDLGPAKTDLGEAFTAPALTDLGPAIAMTTPPEPTQMTPLPAAPFEPETWTVRSGDHLWHIAEETLRDRGEATTDQTVARYWRRLINDNLDVVDDADLIYPGLVLQLPQ
jgi:hypothetical protein